MTAPVCSGGRFVALPALEAPGAVPVPPIRRRRRPCCRQLSAVVADGAHADSVVFLPNRAGPSEFEAPVDCRFTQRGDRLYLHVLSWPMRHIHLQNFAGKVAYAQLLNDASEIRMTEIDPESKAQNTHMPGSAGELILELPIQAPHVLVPVIELFLT